MVTGIATQYATKAVGNALKKGSQQPTIEANVDEAIEESFEEGSFSIFDWKGYPEGATKPKGHLG